jgi:hypothetical protein
MHTTLALMTLTRQRSAVNATAEDMLDYDEGACVPLPLASPDAVSDLMKLELRAWMTAQILMLIHEFDVATMLEAAADDCDGEVSLYRNLVEVAESRVSVLELMKRLRPRENRLFRKSRASWGFASL